MNDRTKKILIGIAVAGIFIVTLLLIYGVLVSPSRQPYQDALTQYKNVGRANAELTAKGASLNASRATDEEFEKNITAAETALESVKKENEALGKKLVLQDGEGKRLYDTFNEKLEVYLAYNTDTLNSMRLLRPALITCNNSMLNVSENQASLDALRACVSRLNTIQDIPDADYATLVATFTKEYTDLVTTTEQIIALADPKGADKAQYDTLNDTRSRILENLSTAGTTFAKDVQTHRKAVLTTDVAKNLSDYLEDKSRIF